MQPGFTCPRCRLPGCRVTNTYRKANLIRRRRVCPSCKKSIYTFEILSAHVCQNARKGTSL